MGQRTSRADTDGKREALSRALMEALWSVGARVQAFGPAAMKEPKRIYDHREEPRLARSRDEVIAGAAVLAACAEWKVLRTANIGWFEAQRHQAEVVSIRGLFEPLEMRRVGIGYYAVG